MLQTWNNRQYAPEALGQLGSFRVTKRPGASSAPEPLNQGHWSATSIGATPHRGDCLFRLICQESSRAKEKAGDFRENKRACFSENSQPFPCALAHRRAGKAGLPGSVSSSLHSPLRHTAWKISLIPSAMEGVRGGSSSPAGSGAAPQRSPCRCGTLPEK